MIRHILFDADGVCIQAERFSRLLERERRVSSKVTRTFFSTIFQDCLIGKGDLKQVLPPYLTEWGINCTVDEFLDYWFSSENKPNKELLDHVQALRKEGIKCSLATNQEKYRTEYIWNKMKFSNFFDSLFSSAYIGYTKPNKEYFENIYKAIGSPSKEEVLLVDNTPGNIKAAEQFGFQGILYESFENYRKLLFVITYQ